MIPDRPPSTDPTSTDPTHDEAIRAAVRARYGSAARRRLEQDAAIPLVAIGPDAAPDGVTDGVTDGATAVCCAPAGGTAEGIATGTSVGDACCTPAAPTEGQLDTLAAFYQDADTGDLPDSVTDIAFGCGNPTAIAEWRTGETVLDLGAGGGIDCFLAARQVGPTGRVIGVDMTDEMVALARKNAATVGATNVEFRHGAIEALPVDDASVDVIISNCVINLSTDKDAVLREAYRVLTPGGRFRVSDIVLTRALSVPEAAYLAQWSGCIAGALHRDDFAARLTAAGFVDVRVEISPEAVWQDGAHSALITATKPA